MNCEALNFWRRWISQISTFEDFNFLFLNFSRLYLLKIKISEDCNCWKVQFFKNSIFYHLKILRLHSYLPSNFKESHFQNLHLLKSSVFDDFNFLKVICTIFDVGALNDPPIFQTLNVLLFFSYKSKIRKRQPFLWSRSLSCVPLFVIPLNAL